MAGVQEQPCSSEVEASKPTTEDKNESLKIALNALVQGKRHLLVQDIPMAMVALGQSCELLAEMNGYLGNETAEAHYYYSRALLEQARSDLSVIDSGAVAKAEDGEEEEKSSEENESESESEEKEASETEETIEGEVEETAETEASNGSPVASESNNKKEEDDTTEPKQAAAGASKAVESSSSNGVGLSEGMIVDDEKPSTSNGTGETNGEGEEELSNLELAWEVAEVAKLGYSKQLEELRAKMETDKTEKLKETESALIKRLADTHSLLGEIATESEMYSQAVEDVLISLSLFAQVEDADSSRDIAQCHFQMGLALSFDKKYKDAIASFKKSISIIQDRIDILSKKTPSESITSEVEELKKLLPELQEKVADTIDAEREMNQAKKEEDTEQEIMLRNSPVKNPNPPAATNISHLVKKKKKADAALPEEPPLKKQCTGGEEQANSNGNGEHAVKEQVLEKMETDGNVVP